MGRSGNIGWGISNYFGLPNRKRNLLTKEFLQTFKKELIKIDTEHNEKYDRPPLDYEKETYYSFYGQVAGNGLFYEALRNACEKHNLIKAIYNYAQKLPWYDSDCFDDDIVVEMMNKGLIEKDTDYYKAEYDESAYMQLKYKLVKHFKGYDAIKYGNWFDDKNSLEDIYKNDTCEVLWLN